MPTEFHCSPEDERFWNSGRLDQSLLAADRAEKYIKKILPENFKTAFKNFLKICQTGGTLNDFYSKKR